MRTENEVIAIDRNTAQITVKNRQTDEVYQEAYDALVLAPGAAPIRPPLPGIDLPGIFALRTIPGSRRIRDWIDQHQVKQAVVVGGGFIGLEMAENLVHRGIAVTLIEAQTQVMAPLDPEMAVAVHERLRSHHVTLCLGDSIAEFKPNPQGGIDILIQSGASHTAELVDFRYWRAS